MDAHRNAATDANENPESFELGKPVLVCRWRIANRHLPLQNRHMRALLARHIEGTPQLKPLVAWAKQHIEWTLDQGSTEYPCGVLMLVVDEQGKAAMTVGPYEPLQDASLASLAERAAQAQGEAASTGVAPETLWLARDGQLSCYMGACRYPSGATSLALQLAATLNMSVETIAELPGDVAAAAQASDEAFLVSDEHGVVPASDASGPCGTRLEQGYQRLLAKA